MLQGIRYNGKDYTTEEQLLELDEELDRVLETKKDALGKGAKERTDIMAKLRDGEAKTDKILTGIKKKKELSNHVEKDFINKRQKFTDEINGMAKTIEEQRLKVSQLKAEWMNADIKLVKLHEDEVKMKTDFTNLEESHKTIRTVHNTLDTELANATKAKLVASTEYDNYKKTLSKVEFECVHIHDFKRLINSAVFFMKQSSMFSENTQSLSESKKVDAEGVNRDQNDVQKVG